MFCLRPTQYAWFLGAGASAAAGIPTGYAMIADFKKQIFCELAGVKLKEVDADDPLWIDRINSYLESRSDLPPLGDPQEYAAAFEAVHPTPEDRRNYIAAAVGKGTPSYAHRVLASLITTGRVPCIFSPNFDNLVETAAMMTDQLVPAGGRANIAVAGIDNVERATLALRESRPLLAKIHGDYQSVHIKNTTAELRHQDQQMRQVLTLACGQYPVADVQEARRNPFLSRSDMRTVMARSLNLYLKRNGGRLPRRLVIHKTTSFKEEELRGVFDAFSTVKEVECLEIGSRGTWRGVWLVASSKKGVHSEPDRAPVPRGAMLMRTGNSALVWVAGNAPAAGLGDKLFYQGAKSIPKPLNIIRHAGSGPLEIAALETVGLTKMDWNNDALYDPVPVTIRYSQKLAKTIANVPGLPGNHYPYRLFM